MTEQYEVDIFYHYANEYRKRLTEESDIEKLNVTDEIFWPGLWSIKKHGGVIKIQVNAPPYTGKTLTAIAINNEILKRIYRRKMLITDLDRDQVEYNQTIKNDTLNHTSRVVDEDNPLAETGENSTIEDRFATYASDVMAQREIDTIYCSPTTNTDKNTLLFLEVFSTDKAKKENHCKLFYKINTGGIEYKQLLGIVTISVKEALELPWYPTYRKEKFEKMQLLTKHGVFNPNRLEYAKIALEVIEEFKDAVMVMNIKPTTIEGALRLKYSKSVMALSMLGLPSATKEVLGVLSLYKEQGRISKMINDNKKELADPEVQLDTKRSTELRNQNITLNEARQKANQIAKELTEELQRLTKLRNVYKRELEVKK